jgi:hypothetical protein
MNKILSIQLPESPQQLSAAESITHGIKVEVVTKSALLELNGFGVTFGNKTVLSEISLF